MERAFDSQLDELKRQILVMGGYVEKALTKVTTAFAQRQASEFDTIVEIENKINEVQIQIDNFCLELVAKNAPVAKDLRFIFSILKINTDLERMGDQTMNISYNGRDYLGRNPLPQASDIVKMGEIVRGMVKSSLDCFVRGDVEQAKKVLLIDDQVDELKDKVFHELAAYLKTNSQDVDGALDLILISRNLERLGDHATNVAEDVIFAQTGKDIRHGGHSS